MFIQDKRRWRGEGEKVKCFLVLLNKEAVRTFLHSSFIQKSYKMKPKVITLFREEVIWVLMSCLKIRVGWGFGWGIV